MGSIIDEIHSVESLVEKIKSTGRKQIQSIYDAAAKKESEMQDYFGGNFNKESQEMEQALLERISEYEEELKEQFKDPSALLEGILKEHKGQAARLLTEEFWKK